MRVLHIVPAPLVSAATPASVLASFLPAHPVAGMRGAGRGPPQAAAAMVLVAGEWLAGGPGWYVALWW